MKEKTILIVDDLVENLQIIVSIFEQNRPDLVIYQANSGKMGLELALKILPDIIFTDWDMPEMSGIDLIRELKKHKVTREIPVIMATGIMISPENLREAIEAGAVDFLTRPIVAVELLARTHAALLLSEQHKNALAEKDRQLTERVLASLEIKQKNEDLIKLNAEKDKFFSIIAHDLKSPFNSIMGFSEILVEQVKDKDYKDIEKYAGIIMQSSEKAVELLMNLIEWSRSKTGRIEFTPEFFEIVEQINEVIFLLGDTAIQKSISLVVNFPRKAAVYADKAMINTVLRNLVSNAIKFTRPGGEIIISAVEKPGELTISVSDNGVGISKNRIDKLFNLDGSYSTSGTNNEKGTGLGLILCKEFIEKHDGIIWVESEEGKGSTFSFAVPAK